MAKEAEGSRPWMESETDRLARWLHEQGEAALHAEDAHPIREWVAEREAGETGLGYVDWKADRKHLDACDGVSQ